MCNFHRKILGEIYQNSAHFSTTAPTPVMGTILVLTCILVTSLGSVVIYTVLRGDKLRYNCTCMLILGMCVNGIFFCFSMFNFFSFSTFVHLNEIWNGLFRRLASLKKNLKWNYIFSTYHLCCHLMFHKQVGDWRWGFGMDMYNYDSDETFTWNNFICGATNPLDWKDATGALSSMVKMPWSKLVCNFKYAHLFEIDHWDWW